MSAIVSEKTKLKVEIEVSTDAVAGLLCSAFEGGSNYWLYRIDPVYGDGVTKADVTNGGKFVDAEDRSVPWEGVYVLPFVDGCGLKLTYDNPDHGGEEVAEQTINRQSLMDGLRSMAEKSPSHFGDVLSENCDADTGDVFLQHVLFGEVIFG